MYNITLQRLQWLINCACCRHIADSEESWHAAMRIYSVKEEGEEKEERRDRRERTEERERRGICDTTKRRSWYHCENHPDYERRVQYRVIN